MIDDDEPFKRFESDHNRTFRNLMMAEDEYMRTYPLIGVLLIIASVVGFGLGCYAAFKWWIG